MTLTQKEQTLIKDMKDQEQLCIEKYMKYANDACDGGLKNLFSQIGQVEQQHLQTLNQIESGTVPTGNGGGTQPQVPAQPSNCSAEDKNKDKYLCQDALATEKHASTLYNISIFEFSDTAIRNLLNHIQKEEQEHGEKIYAYMSMNGMYA
ncbi:MAG: spore coat protein [Ruminococcaceae bacterium]|nr:spore coat protein [Oscillospiraceae bacterium]